MDQEECSRREERREKGRRDNGNALVSDKDLEPRYDLGQRHAAIGLPLPDLVGIVDEDDKVFLPAS